MEVNKGTRKQICQFPPKSMKSGLRNLMSRAIVVAMSLTFILMSTLLVANLMISGHVQNEPDLDPIIENLDFIELDVFLLRMDDNGNLLWDLTFGSSGSDYPTSLLELSSGGFAVLSKFNDNGNESGSLTRIDANGEVLWNRIYPSLDLCAYSLVEMKLGGFAIFYEYPKLSNTSILITDNEGSPTEILEGVLPRFTGACTCDLSISFGGPISSFECRDGGFAFADVFGYCGAHTAIYRVDAFGNMLWTKEYLLADYWSYHGNIIEHTQGGYFFWVGGGYQTEGTLVRTDSQGNVIWSRYYSQSETAHPGYDVIECRNGDFMLFSPSQRYDSVCLRINNEGETIWERTIGVMRCIELTSGKFVMLDWVPQESFTLECVDANGNHQWKYSTALTSCESLNLVACDDGSFAVVGSANSSVLSGTSNDIPQSMTVPTKIGAISDTGIILTLSVKVVAMKPSLTS